MGFCFPFIDLPRALALAAAALLAGCAAQTPDTANVNWAVYGGGSAGQRFAALDQINLQSIDRLKIAWRHDTGEGGLQTSPLAVDGRLFGFTPDMHVIALDGATGERLWTFASPGAGRQPARGLAYWSRDGDRRILAGVMGDLWALDPDTGLPISSFGADGRVDLRKGLGGAEGSHAVFMTSPGVIFQDLVIVGFRTSETPPAAPGAIRAYDVRSGELRWTYHTIPAAGETGHESWPPNARSASGAANNWTGMVLDEARGIVYAPTGSAAPDFFGGGRPGDNLGANTLLALDARTGSLLWQFQAVHHDILDRDLPSPPVLLQVTRDGMRVDAIAQATKQGYLFVLNRTTGDPLFPIEERPVPASDVPGETASLTQPVPVAPEPFARQELTPDLLTDRTPEARTWAIRELAKMRNEGPFTPLGLDRATVVFPGFDGGAEWGGQAVDPRSSTFYINSNDIAWTGGLRRATPGSDPTSGGALYERHCAMCHGADRLGAGVDFPALAGIGSRRIVPELTQIIRQGVGRMPGFPNLAETEIEALVAYLRTDTQSGVTDKVEVSTSSDAPSTQPEYVFTGYRKFLDPDGYPAVMPPWGTMSAIDLNTGRYLWRRPLGEYPALAAQGSRHTGSENYGGPLVTTGGVVFIGATVFDRKFRALNAETGETVFEADLPFAGTATPITYMIDNRQYVVIATSGARDKTGPQGSAYVAFALEEGLAP